MREAMTKIDPQESVWIEIIRRMESLYAELANSQSEIERINKELLEANEFTDDIILSMINALIVTDSQGNIRLANQATLDLLGYEEEEILDKPIEILFAEQDAKKIFKGTRPKQLVRKGPVRNVEMNFLSKCGKQIPMNLNISAIEENSGEESTCVVIVAQDLREIKRLLAEAEAAAAAERTKATELEKAYKELQQLQRELIQSEKMASIGKLAAGVAHEINNPLGGILVYSHLLLEDLAENEPVRENLKKIIRETTRCKEIVKGLLEFARQSEPQLKRSEINEILNTALSFVEFQASLQNIQIIRKFHPSLPMVMVDATQIEQVFMNIILNAQEAMQGNGTLMIVTKPTEDGKFVELEFTDTGCGIPPENLERLFEPFFTTKRHGTGLGLAISYGIIERHNGNIAVKSKVGEGTTVTIKLPALNMRRDE
jgi:two-component system NtrC family sensor kinase